MSTTIADVLRIVVMAEDQASATLHGVGDALGSISDGVGTVAQPLADVANGILAIDTAAAGAAVAITAFAINSADDFERAFREIATLVDQPIEGLQGFREAILDYASTSTQSLEQVTTATYNAISMGVDYTKSLDAVAIAEKLAVAGKAELNETLVGLVGTLNAYGAGMDQAGDYADVFFSTVKAGKTTIPELNASLANVAVAANGLGIPFATVGAAMATLTSSGLSTGEAATKLTALFGELRKPTDQVAQAAKDVNMAWGESAVRSRTFEGVMVDLKNATGGNATEMGKLFGSQEAFTAAQILSTINAQKFADSLELMKARSGSVEVAFEKMKDTTDTLAQAIKVAAVNFGTPLLESFNGVEDALAKLFKAFSEAGKSDAFKPLQEVVKKVLDELAALFTAAAKHFPEAMKGVDFSSFTEALGDLGGEIKELLAGVFGDINITTVEGLRSAIQTVVNSLETLTRITTGITTAFQPVANAIGETIRHFNDLDKASKVDFGETIGSAKALVDVGIGLGSALIAIGKAGIDMGAVLDIVFGGAKIAVNTLQVAFDTASLGILKLVQAMPDFVKEGLGTSTKEIDQLIDGVFENALRNSKEFNDGWNQATVQSSESTEKLKASLDRAQSSLDAIKGSAQTAGDGLSGAGKDARQFSAALSYSEMDAYSKILSEFGGDLRVFGDGMSAAGVSAQMLGQEVAQQAASTDQAAQSTKALKGVTFEVIDGVKSYSQAMGIASATTSEHTKKVEEATKKSQDFELKMEEIASNERIKMIDFYVQLETTQLETDMERVKATFASIDNVVTSTGDLIGSLFDNLISADSFRDKFNIEDQIAKEDKRRQDALDLQKQLAAAEIARVEAQTAALNRGDALITIQGDGLAPQLEAFMWEVLKAIRVRANADFQDFLLGMGA
jgi:TP901 family phage tail tape measure protein